MSMMSLISFGVSLDEILKRPARLVLSSSYGIVFTVLSLWQNMSSRFCNALHTGTLFYEMFVNVLATCVWFTQLL